MRGEIAVSAPADAAWLVIGERFGRIGEWASAITRSALDGLPGVGQVRTCHTAGFGPFGPGVIRERLLSYDPGARSLSYEATDGMPGFITHAVNRWSVSPEPGGRCTVKVHATLILRPAFRPLAPALRWRIRADTGQVLAELRHRIETGKPHPAKAAVAGDARERA